MRIRTARRRSRTKDLFHEFYRDYYELFDYLRKVKLDPRQIRDFGIEAAFRLNSACPIIVKRGGKAYLDEVAADYRFESSGELWEHLLSYKPKYKIIKQLREELYLDIPDEVC